jgi:hypothetical protein
MEAGAVAQGAQLRGISFGALKVVSDEAGFVMPPVGRFYFGGWEFSSHVSACM